MIKSIQYTNLENVPSYYAAGVKSLTQFIKKPMEFCKNHISRVWDQEIRNSAKTNRILQESD